MWASPYISGRKSVCRLTKTWKEGSNVVCLCQAAGAVSSLSKVGAQPLGKGLLKTQIIWWQNHTTGCFLLNLPPCWSEGTEDWLEWVEEETREAAGAFEWTDLASYFFIKRLKKRPDAAAVALCYKVDLSFHLMMGKVIYSLLLFLACRRWDRPMPALFIIIVDSLSYSLY